MYTAILSVTAAAVSVVGMLWFGMSSGIAGLLLIVGITGGLTLDDVLAKRRANTAA